MCANCSVTPLNSSGTSSCSTNPHREIYADFMLTSFPPLIAMRAQLGDELVRETYLEWVNDVNEADDGSLRYHGEYLVSVT